MPQIPITSLVPTSGAEPSSGYDPVSHAAYLLWDVGDEARFGVIVPDDYAAGGDFHLTMEESTPTASANHKWRAHTLLIRPGVHPTDETAEQETFEYQYSSSSSPDRLTARALTVTGASGTVSDTPIAAGDLLSFTLKRIAASSGEDPAGIKVFGISVDSRRSETSLSECAGRVGSIIDTVRDLFNESAGGFLPQDFILRSMNRCLQDLAQEGYWRRETWIPAFAGQTEIDLLSAIADFQDIYQVRFSGATRPMTPLPGYSEYQELAAGSKATRTPELYCVQSNRLLVLPAPSRDIQSGFLVYHSYLPPELTCSNANANPPIPRGHDMVFVHFVLQEAFLRDRHAPGADIKFQEFRNLYEREKQDLLAEGDTSQMVLRPYR